jgi:uncharacterized membrane protein YvbJ
LVFCTKCGKELIPESKFCSSCGNPAPKRGISEEFEVAGNELVEKVRSLLHEGNVRRIIIRDQDGRTVLEIPITAGIIGVILAPILAAVGAIAAMAMKYTIVVERKE